MTGTGKHYSVKQWYGNKVAQEIKCNITMCEVFGILKETEKAIYAVLNLGCDFHKTQWVPKSVLIESDDPKAYSHETYRFDSYNEAIREFRYYWTDVK